MRPAALSIVSIIAYNDGDGAGRHDPQAQGAPPAVGFGERRRKKIVAMAADLHQERQQAHALLDLVPPAKLGAVRHLLEGIIDEDGDTLSPAEAKAIAEAEEWSRRHAAIPHEQVLAELGLTMEAWEKMSREP